MTKARASKATRGVRHIEVFAEASSIENWRKQVIAGQPDAGRFAFIAADLLRGRRGALTALADVAGCDQEEAGIAR
jgi:hypothetical protein